MASHPVLSVATLMPGDAAYILQRVRGTDGFDYPTHEHGDYGELVYVESGEVRHLTARGEVAQPAGRLILLRCGTVHAVASPGVHYSNLNYRESEWCRLLGYLADDQVEALTEGTTGGGNGPPWIDLGPEERLRMEDDLRHLFDHQVESGSRARLGRFLLSWLPVLVSGRSAQADQRPPWLTQLMSEIDDLLEADQAAADLPRRAGVSAAHLARTVRRHLGCTPSAWLNRRRVERAALLLSHTDRPLIDIALSLGFGSLSYFHRRFRAAHGLTPASYRRRHGMVRA